MQPNIPPDADDYPRQLDLVMEIVSEDSDARKRDFVDKRIDYARANIIEYWLVDPLFSRVTVLSLDGDEYLLHCECNLGETAHSALLPNFAMSVDEIFSVS